MLFLFDVDGTLIRSYLREQVCSHCNGSTRRVRWDYERERAEDEFCKPCRGTGKLVDKVHAYDVVHVLPGVQPKLTELWAHGHQIALVTNQGGVAFGYEKSTQVNRKMHTVCRALGFEPREHEHLGETFLCRVQPVADGDRGGPVHAYIALHHPNAKVPGWKADWAAQWRKPGPGMIVQAMKDYGVNPTDTVFVGDLETDRQAAQAAGVGFAWADDFFENANL